MGKKIVIIGASGFIGSAILKEALERGHQVTGMVRQPEKITIQHSNLKVKKGDASVLDQVIDTCRGHDAVISAYNPGWKNPNIAEDTLCVYPVIIEGIRRAGVSRLQITGGAGSLYVSPGLKLMDAGIIPQSYLPAVHALATILFEVLPREKQLDWVFFSPAQDIMPGERTGKFRLGMNDLVKNDQGISRISVEDFAMAMIDELETEKHHRERFTIGY